ncbi:hypothetical protein SAMN04488581_2652 [Mycolicibacterium neoaurum]|uniref:hypothetical protein n=1 Tax=Mycolicibacterium neoaurum TaxID=1795 RepID=UPI00056C36B8|nr:hypothetical protein [Mycolicibacterium neoaurum]SDD60762.1 hypothetical protein SAMN04488581_2652 [Mycolicibacterium neoaurum]
MSLRFQQVFTSVFRNRFSDLPVFPPMVLLPESDGDMAELDQLADEAVMAGVVPWPSLEPDWVLDEWPTFQQLWDAAGRNS